jgi:predicted AAA+ superfamily ATPase
MSTPRDFQSSYVRRVIDDELDELFSVLPAILIDGPKAVGKTATSLQRAATIRRLDRDSDRQILTAAPNRISLDTPPVLLDEWQRLPTLWDTVRRRVDHHPAAGQFLLTGSTPATITDVDTHTGAGRISTLRMRPLTLTERLDLSPTVSLQAVLNATVESVAGQSELGLADYVNEIAAGGFPGLRHLNGRALRNQLDSYIDLIINRELADAGLSIRRPQTALGWLRAYAAATATTTTWEKIRRAATPGDNPPAATTARPYIELLTNLRILDPLPAWLPTSNHLRSLTNSPKHHLADPALALRLLNLGPEHLLDGTEPDTPVIRDGTFLGALFESLVALTLRVYAQNAEANVYHVRTKGGRHEVDFIIEHTNCILAIETKLAPTITDKDLRHLHWLRETLPHRNTSLAVITTGPEAYTRTDGIHIIPLALLGP